MAEYQILYWFKKIPVQVRAKDEAGTINQPLPARFQEAIDLAAMQAKIVGADAYAEGFKWVEGGEREGSAQAVVSELLSELEAEFAEIDWLAIAEDLTAAQSSSEVGEK